MSFTRKWFGGFNPPSAPPPLAPASPITPVSQTTVAPTVTNVAPDLDVASQKITASLDRGRTSTLLTGGAGELDDRKLTSRILLGQ